MDTTWLEVLAAVCVATGVIFLPGAAISVAMRASGRMTLLAAPLVSMTLIGATAVLATGLGLPWGYAPLIGATTIATLVTAALTACVLWAKRRLTSDTQVAVASDAWNGRPQLLVAALALSVTVYLARLIPAIGHPYAVSQTYDAPFHLNVVQSMLERSDGSFLHINPTVYGSDTGFYPAVWHEIVSLVVLATGVPIAPAVNAMTIAMTAVVWPLSIALCVGWMTRSWNVASVGALMAFSLSQMPTHFVWFGVLYPNLLSYILMIPMLALAAMFAVGARTEEIRLRAFVLGMIATPGYAVVHPSGFITFILLVFPILASGIWMVLRRNAPQRLRIILPTTGIMMLVAVYVAINQATFKVASLAYMRGYMWYWEPIGSLKGGLVRAATLSAGWNTWMFATVPIFLGIIVIIGGFYALRSARTAWLPFSHLIVVALYLVAYRVSGEWRPYIIGMWYSDPHRFAAMLGITAVPLLALGTWAIAQGIATVVQKKALDSQLQRAEDSSKGQSRAESRRWDAPQLTALATVVTVFVVSQFSAALTSAYEGISAAMSFDDRDSDGVLSSEEYDLMEDLPTLVPGDTTLIGNPWNGSAYTPSISGLDFAFPHTVGAEDHDANFLAHNLNNPSQREEVCRIVHERHITHILDFGNDYLWNGDPNGGHLKYPALESAFALGTAELVAQRNEARLLRITICD